NRNSYRTYEATMRNSLYHCTCPRLRPTQCQPAFSPPKLQLFCTGRGSAAYVLYPYIYPCGRIGGIVLYILMLLYIIICITCPDGRTCPERSRVGIRLPAEIHIRILNVKVRTD